MLTLYRLHLIALLFTACVLHGCHSAAQQKQPRCGSAATTAVAGAATSPATAAVSGAERLAAWLPMLTGKNVALVVNHTALVGKTHLADTLKGLGVTIRRIFAPEHGFRGNADAGEHVKDGLDIRTGLPVISLLWKQQKADGRTTQRHRHCSVRHTGCRRPLLYLHQHATLRYGSLRRAAKETHRTRQTQPQRSYTDGPVLEPAFKSFVGMHPIPVVHGLTAGELHA